MAGKPSLLYGFIASLWPFPLGPTNGPHHETPMSTSKMLPTTHPQMPEQGRLLHKQGEGPTLHLCPAQLPRTEAAQQVSRVYAEPAETAPSTSGFHQLPHQSPRATQGVRQRTLSFPSPPLPWSPPSIHVPLRLP